MEVRDVTSGKEIDKEKHIESYYVFVFLDGSTYDMTCGISYKDAVWEMAKYCKFASEHMRKALEGFDSNDVEGITKLVNFYTSDPIIHAFIVKEKLL